MTNQLIIIFISYEAFIAAIFLYIWDLIILFFFLIFYANHRHHHHRHWTVSHRMRNEWRGKRMKKEKKLFKSCLRRKNYDNSMEFSHSTKVYVTLHFYENSILLVIFNFRTFFFLCSFRSAFNYIYENIWNIYMQNHDIT